MVYSLFHFQISVRQKEVESKPEPKLPSFAERTRPESPVQSLGMSRERMEANTKATLDEFCLLNDMKVCYTTKSIRKNVIGSQLS